MLNFFYLLCGYMGVSKISFSKQIAAASNCLREKTNPYVPIAGIIEQFIGVPIYRPPVIDENLKIIARWGIQWWTLVFVNPFFLLFGVDLLRSVRADRVARGVLNCFDTEKNNIPLSDRFNWVRRIRREILGPLDHKSHKKYHGKIDETRQQLLRFLPEPISIRPKEPEVLAPDPTSLVWPPQLSDLGIDEETRDKAKAIFAGFLESLNSGQASGPSLICERTVTPELTLRFFYDEERKLRDVMLMTTQEFGRLKGFLCYSLTHGQYFFRREAPREEGRVLLRKVAQGMRGLMPPLAITRTSEDNELPEKWEVITRCPEGTLSDLFRTQPLMQLEQMRSLVGDLVSALAYIHRQPKEVKYKNAKKDHVTETSHFFHGNISCATVLVAEKEGKWEAALSDFDAAGFFNVCSGTPGFRSPEHVRFFNQKEVLIEQVVKFNLENAQKGDVWALGLVVLAMLCGEKATGSANREPDWGQIPDIAKMNIPPLPCLQECFATMSFVPECKVADIQQVKLDQDLGRLQQKYKDNHGENNPETDILWEIVKGMLQVDPQKRISAQEALRLLQNAPK